MAKEQIRFVRIRGKIRPIRVKRKGDFKGFSRQKRTAISRKKRREVAKASLFSLAGLSTTIGAGIFASASIKRARAGEQMAMKLFHETGGAIPRSLKKSAVGALRKRSRQFTLGGQLVGGALLSQGIQRALRAAGVEKESLAVDIGAEAGSQLAAEIITRSFRRGQGEKIFQGTTRLKARKAASLVKAISKRVVSRQLRLKL